jgi:hypothetical protein
MGKSSDKRSLILRENMNRNPSVLFAERVCSDLAPGLVLGLEVFSD